MDGLIRTKSFTVDRAAYLKAMWTRGLGRRLPVVAALYVLMGIFVAATVGLPPLTLIVPFVAITFAAALGIRYLIVRRSVYDPLSAPIYDDPRTIAFSVDGIRVSTRGGVESLVPWSRINRVEVRGEFVLLFISRIQHLIVPQSTFATSGDREAFWLLIRARGLVKAEPPKLP